MKINHNDNNTVYKFVKPDDEFLRGNLLTKIFAESLSTNICGESDALGTEWFKEFDTLLKIQISHK